jgi:outer membrane protein assembly factor BamB
MKSRETGAREPQKRLRLWPGIAVVLLQWLLWLVVPTVLPQATAIGVIGGLLCGLAVLVWWAFFSRAPRFERWGAIVLMIAAMAATPRILHPSIATGMMGMMLVIYATPMLCLMLVFGAAASRRLAPGLRRATLAASILAACGSWALLRTDGITGAGRSQFAWRWTKTPEQQLLSRAGGEAAAPPAPPAAEFAKPQPPPRPGGAPVPRPAAPQTVPPPAPPPLQTKARTSADWPGFRGPSRDATVTGLRIKADWASSPPVELWRRPVGPGWSSFAVHNGLVYTQEQRGDFEVVACYNAATGDPVWTHRDAARFWESNAGAGPRATPALHGGRVYTFGATGILNALDAGNGRVLWTRNAASDTGAKVPGWGFSGSPLVADDIVIVAASGWLSAYDLATGNPRWRTSAGGGSYSSPQLLTIAGVAQVVLLNGAGATSVAPADGRVLWKHSWPGSTILQPALTADGGLLITTSDMSGGAGTRRLAVAHGPNGWTVDEVWTSRGLKPYFNDIVVHKDHAFGFDGSILACIDLKDGARKWKGGRYGHGQLLLLRDQDLLLVLSEHGELALVAATPDQFTEIARLPAMEDKTWNHPALAGDLLLVRNGQEMVAFRLPLAGG